MARQKPNTRRPARSGTAIADPPHRGGASEIPKGRSRGQSLLRRVAFALVALNLVLFFCLLVAELGMRVVDVRPPRHERPKTIVIEGGIDAPGAPGGKFVKVASRFRSLGVDMGEYVPGTVFKTVYDSNPRGYFDTDNGVISTINSLGLRGPEAAQEKTTGTFRILGIGDSFTYGAGVRDEDTFLRRLEASLNKNGSYEVLNAGVEGYNTRDEIITLENRWLALKPDLILIGFYLNDCYSDFTFLNRGEEQGVNKPKPPGLAQVSFLYDYVQHSWSAYQESQGIKKFYQSQFFTDPKGFLESPGEKSVDWTISRQALARAAEISRTENIPMAVVIFPEFYRLDDRYPFQAIHEHVSKACRSLGLPVLDLFDAFRGKKDRDLWVHPADHHPNEIGHRIAAEAIETFLRQNGLLKP